MLDIILSLLLMAVISGGIFYVFNRFTGSMRVSRLRLLCIFVMATFLLYLQYMWGELWIVKLIPLPPVIVLGNWFPLFLAAFAGIVNSRLKKKPVRRWGMMLLISGVGVLSMFAFVPLSAPECGNEWEGEVCKQTTPHTCSAAAAATALRQVNIDTTEGEMAKLCLTQRGTSWLGLYHGLSRMLQRTDYHVEFFDEDSESIRSRAGKGPLILCCGIDSETARLFPDLVTEYGWRPGIAHSVVLLRYENHDRILMGDPTVGYEMWTEQQLNMLWTGQGLQIVRN